jgi:N,N'-diacetyllegionaminate synthase
MKKQKTFKQLSIGEGNKVFIIAEAGINHNGDLKTALRLIDAAKKAGADAIKFQTYVTEKRVKAGSPIFDILKKCELSHEDMQAMKKHADKKGIIFFSTPFDEESIAFLASIGVSLLKIASFDIVHKSLLRAAAATGIPTIISRGMATKAEIDAATKIFDKAKSEYAILHCISAYPTPRAEINLRAITTLKETYDCPIGYSDHTLDIDSCVYAVARGAAILEKHFTLSKKMKGPDHALSADPREFAELVERVREVEVMLGTGKIESLPVEKGTRMYRRVSK